MFSSIKPDTTQHYDDEISVKASNDAGVYVCESVSYISFNNRCKEKDVGRVVDIHGSEHAITKMAWGKLQRWSWRALVIYGVEVNIKN